MTDERDNDRWDACEEGIELLREGDAEGAVRALEAVIADDPENPHAFKFLGAANYEREEYDKALKAYLTAVELAPDYLGAMIGAGHTLRMLAEFERAIRLGRQILRKQKGDADALYLLGIAHFQRGDYKAAHGLLTQFLETKPEVEVQIEVQGVIQVIEGEVFPAEPE